MAADGYSEFNQSCVANLNSLIEQTNAKIILTSSRRMNKTVAEFQAIMQQRGFQGEIVGKVDDASEPNGTSRASEIESWINLNGRPEQFVILDDDARLADLSASNRLHWVRTTFHRGFDAAALAEALRILTNGC